MSASLGCHLEGFALPHADPHDPYTMRAGIRKRFARRPPKANPALLLKLNTFVRDWIRKNLVPLAPDRDTSLPTWLGGTNYTLKRKQELLRKWEEFTSLDDPSKKYKLCKSFMKDETYVAYKHARGINSRSDEFKCLVGPIFKLIEEELYKNPYFIKHVPVADRPRVIKERLDRLGAMYVATDYTAFESLFTEEIMSCVEFELYDYMTQHLEQHSEFMRACYEVLGGENVCQYKTFVVRLLATRMSGEMCTSLGNGFSNLMFMLFLAEQNKCTGVDGFVEGDDGIFTMVGDIPTASQFSELGLDIKIDLHNRLSTASFCGIIFDEGDCVNVTDPREVLCSLGWTTRDYSRANKNKLLALLRCKSLSYAHQYPGCPIIGAFAHSMLKLTRSITISGVLDSTRSITLYEKDQIISASLANSKKMFAYVAPPMATRLLVEDKYGISIDVQLSIEEQLLSMEYLHVLDFPEIHGVLPCVWCEYFNNYSICADIKEKDLESPALFWPKMAGFSEELG